MKKEITRNISFLVINGVAILCFCAWEFYLFKYSRPLLSELLVEPVNTALHLSLYALTFLFGLEFVNFFFTRLVLKVYHLETLFKVFVLELLFCIIYTCVLTWY